METFLGIMIPFLGTALGSACVFFMKKSLGVSVQRALTGFAAGVMVAASIWSLLIPAIEQSEGIGKLSFLPAFIGFWVGVLFLLLLDHLIPHLHVGSNQAEGPKSRLLVELEVDRSEEYYALLRKNGMLSGSMTRQLHHMITRAYFTAVCETIVHDMPREEAMKYVDELAIFFHSGWSGLLRLE